MKFQVNVCYCHGSYEVARCDFVIKDTRRLTADVYRIYGDLRRIFSIRNAKKRRRKNQSRYVVDTRPKSFCRSENIRQFSFVAVRYFVAAKKWRGRSASSESAASRGRRRLVSVGK